MTMARVLVVFLGALSLTAFAQTSDPPKTFKLLPSSLQGWVWTGDGRVLFSIDGRSMYDITPPIDGDQVVEGVTFVPGGRGWVLLRAPKGPLTLRISTDSGATWKKAQLPLDPATLEAYAGANLSFADNEHGWLAVSWQTTTAPFGQMWQTKDGGLTWVKLPQPPTFGRISFDSATRGTLIGGATHDVVYTTSDGGQSWSAAGRAPENAMAGENFNQENLSTLAPAGLAKLPLGNGKNLAARASFADPMRAWVEIHNTTDQESSWALAYTENGGNTYQLLLQGSRLFRPR